MENRPGEQRIGAGWWALILIAFTVVFLVATSAIFAGTFKSTVPVTLTSDRSGIILETNAKVKMRGVQVGRVSAVGTANHGASLKLEIDPDQIQYIPANVEAEIDVTTAFGAKFVELVSPENPTKQRLTSGAVLHSKNVSTEVNTVFENIVDLVKMIDPAKLNAVLTAVADAVRGQGDRIGEATTDLNQVLTALNDRSETIRQDWRSFKKFNDTYAAAAQDILTVLDAASTTSATVVNHSTSLDNLLLNVIGFSKAGTNLLVTSKDNLAASAAALEPTTNLLLKYSPEYTCLLQGTTFNLQNGAYSVFGGADGRTLQFDATLLPGNDPNP
jgi:phospholipid/cholesterol/gamma-HCH transport system substrate-binding protein